MTGGLTTARFASIAATILLSACATEPPPPLMSPLTETGRFGYVDRRTGRDSFEVSYTGAPMRTSSSRAARADRAKAAKAEAYDFALWRAAQIAVDNGYQAFAIDHQDHEVEVTINQGSLPYRRPYYGFGYGRYGHGFGYFAPYGYFGHPGYYGYSSYRYTTLRATVTLAVTMMDEAGADDFDAAATAARQAAKYPDAAASPPSAGES